MLTITVKVSGVEETIAKLDALKGTLNNLEPEFTTLGNWLMDYLANQVFDSEGAISGDPWQPLSQKTLRYKEIKYPGRGILEATGTMRKNYHMSATQSNLVVWNPTPYAKYHQSDEPRTKLPQRKLIDLTQSLEDEIRQRFKDALALRIRGVLL